MYVHMKIKKEERNDSESFTFFFSTSHIAYWMHEYVLTRKLKRQRSDCETGPYLSLNYICLLEANLF